MISTFEVSSNIYPEVQGQCSRESCSIFPLELCKDLSHWLHQGLLLGPVDIFEAQGKQSTLGGVYTIKGSFHFQVSKAQLSRSESTF